MLIDMVQHLPVKRLLALLLIIVQCCNVVFVCCTPASELNSVSVEVRLPLFLQDNKRAYQFQL